MDDFGSISFNTEIITDNFSLWETKMIEISRKCEGLTRLWKLNKVWLTYKDNLDHFIVFAGVLNRVVSWDHGRIRMVMI